MIQETCIHHCMKIVQIRSLYGPYFPVFGPNMGKYGPENSVFGHFSRSAFVSNNTKLDISSKTFIFLKTFNLEFLYIEVWFTDQNCKSLEIEDKINITLVLTRNRKNKGLTRNQIFYFPNLNK